MILAAGLTPVQGWSMGPSLLFKDGPTDPSCRGVNPGARVVYIVYHPPPRLYCALPWELTGVTPVVLASSSPCLRLTALCLRWV
jgi:hypothetical protein